MMWLLAYASLRANRHTSLWLSISASIFTRIWSWHVKTSVCSVKRTVVFKKPSWYADINVGKVPMLYPTRAENFVL